MSSPQRKPLSLVKPLYSLAEVARLLGCSRQTVSTWAKMGALTVVQLGGRPRVPLAALQAHGMVWASIQLAAKVNGLAAGTRPGTS